MNTTMQLIDGNAISQAIIQELSQEIAALPHGTPPPSLTFIRIGDDPASVFYVKKKQQVAAQIGIQSNLILLPDDISQDDLFSQIDSLNQDPNIHGILIQAPLPPHLSERDIFNRVSPFKDVDGFTATNLGKLVQEDDSGFTACTPAGIIELLQRSSISTDGKHVVIVGRSLIVGKPASLLMLKKAIPGNATVTVCHSRTSDLPSIVKQADIVIAAIGKPHFITHNMVKPGATVIDVGINRIDHPPSPKGYKIVGDVDFENVSNIASSITPVPGGVGPMTVALLMKNTLKAFKQQTFSSHG